MRTSCSAFLTQWSFFAMLILFTESTSSQQTTGASFSIASIHSVAITNIIHKQNIPINLEASPIVIYPDNSEDVISTLAREACTDGPIMILQITPASPVDEFKLKISSRIHENIRVSILNMKGKLVRRLSIKRDGIICFQNDLNPGNYIIEVVQESSRRIQKLIRR